MTRAGLSGSWKMYRQLGRSIVELLALSSLSESDRVEQIDQVTSSDAELIDRTFRSPKPVLILASHTGNWELALAAAKRWAGARKVFVVAKPLHSSMFDRFMRRLREEVFGVQIIEPLGAFHEASRALREGGIVVMPIDQAPERSSSTTTTSFLGADVLVDKAPATLAWRTKATILVVAASRDPHHVHVIDRIESRAGTMSSREWIDDAMRRATHALDRFVRAHPEGWLWLHRRWKIFKGPSSASAARSIHLDAPDHSAEASACRKAPV
jgi:Kdo2-lipid IVA lauroyltransferase/acyltransferase